MGGRRYARDAAIDLASYTKILYTWSKSMSLPFLSVVPILAAPSRLWTPDENRIEMQKWTKQIYDTRQIPISYLPNPTPSSRFECKSRLSSPPSIAQVRIRHKQPASANESHGIRPLIHTAPPPQIILGLALRLHFGRTDGRIHASQLPETILP